jgi:hypothetical protein
MSHALVDPFFKKKLLVKKKCTWRTGA